MAIEFSHRSAVHDLLEKADHIHYASALIMYLGFCLPGTTSTGEAKWSVCKIEATAAAFPYDQSVKWANGNRKRELIFTGFAGFSYQYKKWE